MVDTEDACTMAACDEPWFITTTKSAAVRKKMLKFISFTILDKPRLWSKVEISLTLGLISV